MEKPIVLLTGAAGQLGKTIKGLWSQSGLADRYELHPVSRKQLDITSASDVAATLSKLNPAVVINCSAYTAVDKAESDQKNAYLVNEKGPENLAISCAHSSARLIHISTDFVFSGTFDKPITLTQLANPAGVYGASKRAGELAIMAQPSRAVILRTSWLYSPFNANFVKTMLRLMSERESLGVVADQRGAPTSTLSLALAIFKVIDKPEVDGIYHWSDAADISWYDFAVAIQDSAVAAGLLNKAIPISPIKTSDYPTPAARPSYSVLDCSQTEADLGFQQFDWRTQLDQVVQKLKEVEARSEEIGSV
jgi:dTDP-4-dehydrorhamnose reductase|tara:strand:+ start:1245 stop:2165 length:921 start_codon:yes stop_codon:yes gene_type:complete